MPQIPLSPRPASMIELWTIVFLLVVGGSLWLWSDTMRARERALEVCRTACQRVDAQLLDDTVALRRLALRATQAGRRAIWRLYRFEFTFDGATRRTGYVALLGRAVQFLELEYPEGTVFDDQSTPDGPPT